jgi:hypothetical protein
MTANEALTLVFFEPLDPHKATDVSIDEITNGVGDALVARQVDYLVEEGLLDREPATGRVWLTSAGVLMASRLEGLSAYETVSPSDRAVLDQWRWLTLPAREVFRFFAFPIEGDSVVITTVQQIADATRTVIVRHVLSELARKRLLVLRKSTATVRLTRVGQVTVAYGDALQRSDLIPVARGRVRRVRRRQTLRVTALVATTLMFVGAMYPLVFDVPVRRTAPNARVAPEFATQPVPLFDISEQPPRRAALKDNAPPGPCRRDSDLLESATLWGHGDYKGVFEHRGSTQCGLAWWEFRNNPAEHYYGTLHVRLYTDELVVDLVAPNNAQTVIGRVTSTIGACVGYEAYLVLRDGTVTPTVHTPCHEASPGAGVPIE